ncbi:MAG: Hsp70 family protein [Eubacteriaceae bacterium]|nr:Hsp70 family protein [Eubacteriaceae bacterium]
MIVGIDLGTSTSEVSYVNEDGEVIVIPNEEGEITIPSVVHFRENGSSIVGTEAREYLFTRPDSTFMEIKRKFGTDEKLKAHGKSLAPEEIQAHILRYLADCAEDYTDQEVTGAVITVPAYFTDVQRRQTIQAGVLAGLKVERVINEPTAAALDYGLSNLDECEYLLVYDFGGGTLDVTVLELFEGVIDVKSSYGNSQLGGKDFDEVLMKHIAGKSYKAIMEDPRAQMRLKQAAMDVKIALSSEESAKASLPLILGSMTIDMTVTRKEFEQLIAPLVESTGEQINTALSDAGLAASDLQKILLVGGTTRIPYVRQFVEEKLGIIPNAADSPELMVARGAAIQAAVLEGVIPEEKSVILADVCPFSLGLKIVSDSGMVVDKLIPKNVTIPYEQSKVYTAMYIYQYAIDIQVYQGESKNYQEDTMIGSVLLSNLPQRRNERAEAEVTFAYDTNGILNVKARALGNDKTVSTEIDVNNVEFEKRAPVKLAEWEKAKGANKYRPLIRKANKEIEDFVGTSLFITSPMYLIADEIDNLKADLILGDTDSADSRSETIKNLLEKLDSLDLDFFDVEDDDDDDFRFPF